MEKWKKKSVQVFLVAAIISVISAAPRKSSVFDSSYRVPTSLVPHSYELSLKSEVHNGGDTNFGGTVKIKVEIAEETDVVVLHSSGLTIEQPKITHSNGTTIDQDRNHEFDAERDFLKIFPSDPLIRGETFFLEINFTLIHKYSYKSAA